MRRFHNLRTVFSEDSDGSARRHTADVTETLRATFATTDAGGFFDVLCARLELFGSPLTRVVHAHDGQHTLVGVCFDHLVIDGHTLRAITDALWSYLRGEDPAGPDPLPDEEFVLAELAAAGSPAVERDLDLWRELTGGRTYPTAFAGQTRPPGVPAAPETASCEIDIDTTGPLRLTRAAAVLAALTVTLTRTLDAQDEHFTTMVQGARRATRRQLRMAGFLSSWLPARVRAGRSAGALAEGAASALLQATSVQSVHHAEIVRRLEPDLYGLRYHPTERLAPYALFNYLAEPPAPRLARSSGTPLAVPPVPGNVLHGGLRVYGSERPDGRGATIRVVADAAVFGTGFAETVAADLPAAAKT